MLTPAMRQKDAADAVVRAEMAHTSALRARERLTERAAELAARRAERARRRTAARAADARPPSARP